MDAGDSILIVVVSSVGSVVCRVCLPCMANKRRAAGRVEAYLPTIWVWNKVKVFKLIKPWKIITTNQILWLL